MRLYRFLSQDNEAAVKLELQERSKL